MSGTDEDLTVLLERDYRRLLRWYPNSWRNAHGDALLGVLLDEADAADRFILRRGEWWSFAAAGITARLDRVIMRPVRDAAATVMLSLGFGFFAVYFVTMDCAPWATDSANPRAFGPFFDAGPIVVGLWTIALIAAWIGQWWLGRIALLLSIVVALGLPLLERVIVFPRFISLPSGIVTLSVVCALLATAGKPRHGLPLLGASVGWIVTGGVTVLLQLQPGYNGFLVPLAPWFYDNMTTAIVIFGALAAAVALGARRFWTASFTVLLTTVPLVATLDAVAAVDLNTGLLLDPVTPVLGTLTVALGTAMLVLASLGKVRLPSRRSGDATPTA